MTRSTLLLLVLMACVASAEPFQWTTFTSTSNVVDIISLNGTIWTATSGGLSAYDVANDRFEIYNNTRGLGMNSCTAVGHDQHGWIWVALADGRITRLQPETGEVRQIVALEGEVFRVNRILSVGPSVFVAANNGIYRFEYSSIPDNFVVIESIKVLGGFPNEAEVNDVAVFDSRIYAATANGVAFTDVDNDLLSAPASWTNLTTGNSNIPENNIRVLFSNGTDGLWLAGPSHVCRYDGSSFELVTQVSTTIVEFAQANQKVYAANENRLLEFTGETWINYGLSIGSIIGLTSIAIDAEEHLVAGIGDSFTRSGGIVFVGPDSINDPIQAPGIGGNIVNHVGLDATGRLWATTVTDRRGFNIYDGISWKTRIRSADYSQGFFDDDPWDIAFDNLNNAWISSQGGGLLWTDGDSVQVFDHSDATGFDTNGPRLLGISAPSYIITRVTNDSYGNIYIANRIGGAASGPALVRVSTEWIAQGNHAEPWEYFYPPVIAGMSAGEVAEIMVDPFDRVWIGATGGANDKSHVLVDRGAANDTTDDEWFSFNPHDYQDGTTCFPDIQPDILCWTVDKQNYLWIGTESGAFYLQGGLPRTLTNNLNFICLYDMPVGRRVNDIHVDSQDNKWFATDDGVAVLDENFAWIHVFQTTSSIDHPSLLTSNAVNSITSNPATGEFWIGTQDGLSRLMTPYLARETELDEVWPYPNPFRADGTHRMFLDPQKLGGKFDEARLFTITGRLVRELTWNDMITVGWDGRNDDGDLVAGGVYLIVTTSEDGHSATGKVAVLGK